MGAGAAGRAAAQSLVAPWEYTFATMKGVHGLWRAFWKSVQADILAQYRDVAIMLNLLLIIAMMQAGFLGLALIHIDPELLGILEFLHKWATVIVFALFLYTVVVRSVVIASTAHKKAGTGDA
jgi:hypothetical protein